MGYKVSDINSWYTRLNAIRSKHGLSAFQLPTKTSDDKILSSDFVDLKTKMDTTTTQATYIPDTSYNFGNIGVGDHIKQTTKTTIESGLTTMEGICNHCSDYVNKSDDSIDYVNKSDDSIDYVNKSDDSVDHTDNSDLNGHLASDCGDGSWYDGYGGGACSLES